MPKPGDIFLTRITGPVGWLVWLGQALNGDVSKWTHAGIVLDDGTVFEAQPGGAQIRPLYTDREVKYISRPLDQFLDHEVIRRSIVRIAREHVGIGYNVGTYFYLAAYRLRLPLLTKLLRKRVSNDKRLICSQAVDHVYLLAGVHLFDDGRLPYDVTPGDIARLES